MSPPSITIAIVNNKIVCRPNNGHVRGKKDDQVSWTSDHKFSLSFSLLTGKGESDWPFRGSSAPPSGVWNFSGQLALSDDNDPPAYKYTVVIDGYDPLDPIIIVDKK